MTKDKTPLYTIVYIYDANGSPIGFKYKTPSYAENTWDVYYYEKNLQGDIVAVYNSSGTKLISYAYSAWGETTTTYHNGGASTTAINNPYTYRGYYYDKDLGLYYLQSRYYDANICRFISADGYISTGQGLTGYNMFAYCGNNPVNNVDPTGEFPWLILTIIVATTVVGGILGATSDVKLSELNQNNDNESNDSANSEKDLTVSDKIENIIIGAALGMSFGGAVVSTVAVFWGASAGIYTTYQGVTALQTFSIGALAMDIPAFLILPIFNIKIEPIEYETPSPAPMP